MKTRLSLGLWVVVCISELVWTKEDVTNLVPFAEWIEEVNRIDSHPHRVPEDCSGCILNEKSTNHSSKAHSIELTTNCNKEEANEKYLLQVSKNSRQQIDDEYYGRLQTILKKVVMVVTAGIGRLRGQSKAGAVDGSHHHTIQ